MQELSNRATFCEFCVTVRDVLFGDLRGFEGLLVGERFSSTVYITVSLDVSAKGDTGAYSSQVPLKDFIERYRS